MRGLDSPGKMVAVGDLVPLRRSVADARVAGICGGLGERAGIDPVLVRVAAVILALCSGIGLVWYGAAWLLLPRGSAPSPLHRRFPFTRSWPWWLWAVSIGALTAAVALSATSVSLGFVPAIIVAGLWFAGAIPRRTARRPAAFPTGPQQHQPVVVQTKTGPWTPRNVWGRPVTVAETAWFFAQPDPVGLYPAPAPRPRTLRERVTWILVALLGIGLLVLIGLSQSGLRVPTAAYLAVALVVAGIGLVLGAWFRRPRGLLTLTLVLGALTLVMTVPQIPLAQTREQHVTLTSAALGRTYEVSGSTEIDMSDADFQSPGRVDISVWMGDAVLILPRHGNTTVRWEIRSGSVTDPDEVVYREGSGSYQDQAAPLRPAVTVSVLLVDSSMTVVRP